jgi:hypothetical protein
MMSLLYYQSMYHIDSEYEFKRLNPEDCYVPDYSHFSFDSCKEYKESLETNPTSDLACIYVIERPYNGKKYKIIDGRHRHMAYTMSKRTIMPALILKLPF